MFARRFQHDSALCRVVTGWLFAVNVLACRHCPNCAEGMPVIRCRHRYGIDFLQIEDTAHVAALPGSGPPGGDNPPLALLDRRRIDIAERRNGNAAHIEILAEMIVAAAAQSDQGHLDTVIRTRETSRANR